MALFGIRSMVKDRVKRLLGQPESEPAAAPPPAARPAPVAAAPVAAAATATEPVEPAPVAAPPEPTAPEAAPPVVAAPAVAPAAASKAPDPTDDTAGPPILFDDVQAILDDMVRPALQGDGGDISLLKVEDRRIYVRLVGACSTCPSSIMTMKMGVEALLKEEFPQMEELVQVDA